MDGRGHLEGHGILDGDSRGDGRGHHDVLPKPYESSPRLIDRHPSLCIRPSP